MKALSLLLVFTMLLSFAACGTDPVTPDDSGAGDSAADTTPAETTADPLADNLPAETFDGEEIRIWVDGRDSFQAKDEDTVIDGDIVSEAVMARNQAVQDRFDIVYFWDVDDSGDWRDMGQFRQSVLGGDEYDIHEGVTLYTCPLSVYGVFTDLSTADCIDLEKPWYQRFINETLNVGERQFLASGFYDFTTITRTNVYYFNGNMVENYELESPYTLVEKDQWTWEKMIELCEIVADDVNQDGVYDTNDNYGMVGRWDAWITQPATTGYQYTTRNDDGSITVTGLNDQLLEMSEKVYPFITNNNMYWSSYTYGVHPKYDQGREDTMTSMFCNDQALFMIGGIGYASSQKFRDFGAYGVIPSPKYSAEQEHYGTSTSAFCSGIVSTTGSFRISSIIYEALQAESYKTIRPAYFETALSHKYLNDPKAMEMINLAFQNIATELSYNYAQSGIGTSLVFALPTQANLASFFQANSESINVKLADLVAQFESIPEIEVNP